MVCTDRSIIGLIGSFYFIGWCCTILWVPWLADKYGRRWIYASCVVITFCTTFGMFVAKHINTIIAMNFIAGAANSGRLSVGFVYANEFLTPTWQVVFGTTFGFFDGFDTMIIVLWFDFAWRYYIPIASMCMVLCAISMFGAFFVINESPLWQLKMGYYE